MRNKIFGAICMVWGVLMALNWLMRPIVVENEAYRNGSIAALGMGAVMFFAGLYYFLKKPDPKDPRDKKR
jgi:hypothetical protein